MNTKLLLILGLLAGGSVFAAETNTTEQVKGAIAKLKSQTNYSWTVKLELPGMPFTPGPMEGKTEKNGFAVVTQEIGDFTLQGAWKGSKAVVKIDEEWQLIGGADSGDGADRAAMIGQWLTRNKAAADEAESLLGKAKEIKAGDGGLASSDLNEDGAKELLSFGPRGSGASPKNAKGSVKFWLKDGALIKFESRVHGTTAFGPDQEEREIDMTRTVEIHDVGTTKVEVPAEARKKLEAN